MTLKQLKIYLELHQVPKRMYSLLGGLPSEAFCIGKSGGVWEVYYSERGRKSWLTTFDNESDACARFWAMICRELRIEDNSNLEAAGDPPSRTQTDIENLTGRPKMDINYLPLGSVVLLRGGIQKLLIVSRGISVRQNGE